MPLRDPYERLNAAIGSGLIREGLNFQSQLVSGEHDEKIRVWLLQLTQPEQTVPIHVSLVGARNLFSSSSTLRPLGAIDELRHAIGVMLVETVPFVRVTAVNDNLLLRAEFPIDLDAEAPVSAPTVAAAVHAVASSTFRVLQQFRDQVEIVAPERVHVPRWMEPTEDPPRSTLNAS